MLFSQLLRPLYASWRHKWLVKSPFLWLCHLYRGTRLVTHWLVLSFPGVILRCWNEAPLTTVEIWVLCDIVLGLLSLCVYAWLLHCWWGLISLLISKWTCFLLIWLVEDFRETYHLGLVLFSFADSSLGFSLWWLGSGCFLSLKALWFQLAFLDISIKSVKILLNLILFIMLDGQFKTLFDLVFSFFLLDESLDFNGWPRFLNFLLRFRFLNRLGMNISSAWRTADFLLNHLGKFSNFVNKANWFAAFVFLLVNL